MPGEEKDVQDMIDFINKKTGNSPKILAIESDLRSEGACKKLIEKHLSFHGGLDSLCAICLPVLRLHHTNHLDSAF